MSGTRRTETLLREAHREAVGLWPGIDVALDDFSRRAKTAAEESRVAVADLVLGDLYLAVGVEQSSREQGSSAAWERFYRDRFAQMIRVARRHARNEEDAEEIVQQICSEMPERIRKYRGRGSLAGWLNAIVPNIVRDYYRKRGKEIPLPGQDDDPQESFSAANDALLSDAGAGSDAIRDRLDRVACAGLLRNVLRRALTVLKPEWRDLIYHKFAKGLTSREIASVVFRVKEDVLAKWLKKALEKLRKRAYSIARNEYGSTPEELRDCLELLL